MLKKQRSIAVIGAGITGLTAAFYLKRKGISVTLFESGNRAGGVIGSIRRDGFLAEAGPNTLLETSSKIRQLIEDAGLMGRRLEPDPKAEARYVVRYGRPIEMPASVPGFFITPLFTMGAKFAVMREPFMPRRVDGPEESIAQFVIRRLNQEFLDHAIDALVAGIYAGDPYKLSLTHAFPRLKYQEDRFGSLIRGQILGGRERKKSGEVARDRAPKFSFDEGLQVMTDELASQLGDFLKLNTAVDQLTQTYSGWMVKTASGNFEFDSVVYCGTAHKLSELKIQSAQPVDVSPFSEIRHPPVASVALGFRREDVAHACDGFGMLIPKVEGFKTLGTIFSSSLFPNRAPEGHLLLTTYVGGERYPQYASLPGDELVELTLQDLRKLLGVRGKPVFRNLTYWPKAIPQYNVGYGKYRDLLSTIETKCPGLHFAGHYRDGVSLGDSIVSGVNMAAQLTEAPVLQK